MKFPEFDELGNMIGQGFDSGAKVLNNPGVQGLLAAGLGAASQVGKRGVGPLNTLGAAGLAGLGAYGLGRNVNSRNEYNLARIQQLKQQQDIKAAALTGQNEYLQNQKDLSIEGLGIDPLRGQISTIQSNLPNIPNQVPYAPEQGPEYRGAQEQMRGLQSTVGDYDKRKLLSQFDPNNPVLKEQLLANQKGDELTPDIKNYEFGKLNPDFNTESSNRIKFIKYGMDVLKSGTKEEKERFGIMLRAQQVIGTGDAQNVLNPVGTGFSQTFPIMPAMTETPEFKADVKVAETSASERTKNAETIYNEYGLSGKGEMVAGNIKRLDSAMEVLKRTPDFTGAKFEFMPESAIRAFYPKVWEAKQAVELVIQPTLKETLGAQMSEQEGVRVFDRSTALSLSPAANFRKWSLLAKQVKAVHEAKMSVVRYIQKNGNLDGFIGKLPNQFEYTDKALGWDKLPGYDDGIKRMEIVIRGGANSNKGKPKPFSDKNKEEKFQEFKRLNQQ